MNDHFEGKSAHEHLIEARKKGARAMHEHHGTEVSGPTNSALDTAKEVAFTTAFLFMLLHLVGMPAETARPFTCYFAIGFLVWKMGRSALLGWSRLERIHRLIEEERSEIQNNREQEREELTELYTAKGFSGDLLKQVIDVLMADDNRLLEVMLQEELGLSLESYEHPLKQSLGCAIGFVASFAFLFGSEFFFGMYGIFGMGILISLVTGYSQAKYQNNDVTRAIVWNISVFLVSIGLGYLLSKVLVGG